MSPPPRSIDAPAAPPRAARRARVGRRLLLPAARAQDLGPRVAALPAAALGLELEFFVGGWLQARDGVERAEVDRGPQPRDLEELGPQYDEFEPLSLFPTDWYAEPKVAPHREWRYLCRGRRGPGDRRGDPVLRRRARAAGTRSRRRTRPGRKPRSRARRAWSPATRWRSRANDRGQFVGFVQDADGAAEVGGRQAFLTPAICDTLYQLASRTGCSRSRGRVGRSPCSRTRRGICGASATRAWPTARLPERRRGRRRARPRGGEGAGDDARAARDERLATRSGTRSTGCLGTVAWTERDA